MHTSNYKKIISKIIIHNYLKGSQDNRKYFKCCSTSCDL